MTKSQIIAKVAHSLEDEGLIHFPSEVIEASIDDGYALTCLLAETNENVVSISFGSNAQVVDLTALIPTYYRLIAIYSQNLRRWLIPVTFHDIRSHSHRWADTTGNCRLFCPLGARHALFYPSPIAQQDLIVFYKALGETLSSDGIPNFFESYHKLLEYYALSDLLDQDLEYVKSQRYFDLFMTELDALILRMNSRSLLATIQELSCKSTVMHI